MIYNLQTSTFADCAIKMSGQGWIRTTELVRGQIYSLLPLATWLLAQQLKFSEPVEGFEPPTS